MRGPLILIAACLFASGAVSAVAAQDYPNRPIRMFLSGSPGATNDVVSRIITQRMATDLGQQFVSEIRSQGAGIPAVLGVTSAQPDGYTILFGNTGNLSINIALFKSVPYNIYNDLEPITVLATVPFALVINKEIPANNVPELVALLKANPGKYSYASGGVGSPGHLTAELFKMRTGTDIVHVPYRGAGPALIDLMAGRVQLMFDNPPSVMQHIRSGSVRALATTDAKRLATLPDLPTLNEIGMEDSQLASWYGFAAPRGTPRAVIDRLNASARKALQDPEVAKLLEELSAQPWGSTPGEMTEWMRAQLAKWQAVVKASGATLQ